MKPIDVCVMTYNSEKYLDEALTNVEKNVPVNRLIAVDHYSTDRTEEILQKHNAVIFKENISLGYARQLAIENIETEIFMFLDSDVVIEETDWYPTVQKMLKKKDIGAIILAMPTHYPTMRGLYNRYWNKHVPATIKWGFTTGATFIKTKHVKDIKIPSCLDAREDRWIELHLKKKGYGYDKLTVKGVHYFQYAGVEKSAWGGANERILTGLKGFLYVLLRRIITAPLKAIAPAIAYNKPGIIVWNTKHWFNYLKGWLHHDRYWKMKRDSKKIE